MKQEENVCGGGTPGTERAAEAEGKNGWAVPGKFRDVNALAEAYGALEAEFTRRSQRLRELEKRAENPRNGAAGEDAEAEKPRGTAAREAGSEETPAASPATGPARPDTPPGERERATAGEGGAETRKAADAEKTAPARGPQTGGEEALYEAASRSEAVRLKIIGDYLSSLRGADAPLMKGGTGTLAAPPVKPKSISEAGNMALRYFRKDTQA